VREPNPQLRADCPLAVVEARVLFPTEIVCQRGFSSLARLGNGEILFAFRQGSGSKRSNNGVVMVSRSNDNGQTWHEPIPFFAQPGCDCLLMGGLASLPGDVTRIILGRVKLDFSLGGPEPLSDWYVCASDSRDGGQSWSEPGPEIRLFPCWTELYGTSNPHPLSDGRLLWACMGTLGRDSGWQAGVTFTSARGDDYSAPVIIAEAPDRNFADLDAVRRDDGNFLAVIREMNTKMSVSSLSDDEGATWNPVKMTGFRGANIKLIKLRSGAIACFYRDEDPLHAGVSCSVSHDGGENWEFCAQLYSAGPDLSDIPGSPCGYPDVIPLGENRLLCIFHTYPDARGSVDLHQVWLEDRS